MEWHVALFVITSVAMNALSTRVAAQGSEEVRLTGAAVVSVHNPGDSGSASDIGPAFGGSVPGIVVGLRVPFGPGSSRAIFEVGLERSILGNQSTRSASFLTTHRDTTFSALLAWTKREAARVAPTAVGGLTFALRHTVSEVLETPNPFFRPTFNVAVHDDQVLGLTGGLDVPMRVFSRLLVIPTLRVHCLLDGDRNRDGTVKRGIGPVITRLGVGVGVGL